MRKSPFSLLLMVFVINNLIILPNSAQESKGVINVRVIDADRHTLQGARIEIQPTGQTAISDAQGQFTVSGVAPDAYTLKISYVGFAPFSRSLTVNVGEIKQVEAVLQVGQVSEEVVVRAIPDINIDDQMIINQVGIHSGAKIISQYLIQPGVGYTSPFLISLTPLLTPPYSIA